jgi:cytochrome c
MKLIASAIVAAGMPACTPALANLELAKKSNCMACRAQTTKVVGPSYADAAKKYAGDKNAVKALAVRVKAGSGGGVWGQVPMPPNPSVSDAGMETLIKWILAGGKWRPHRGPQGVAPQRSTEQALQS